METETNGVLAREMVVQTEQHADAEVSWDEIK